MRKTILTLVMMLTMALAATAGPAIKATPASKAKVELKGDSMVVSDGNESVTVSGVDMRKVQERINEALDDTLTTGTTVEIGNHKGELTPEDIRVISSQWAVTSQVIACASILGLLALVMLVLFFRYLNRRNKYRVIEKAIMNNYPLNELSLGDVKRSAIYVQQPVVASAPAQPGPATVGSQQEGRSAGNPIVMTGMVNWRALMPAARWMGWGLLLVLFSAAIGDGNDPFWPIGSVLILVGIFKGFILYKEQQALEQAWSRAEQQRASQPQQEPMREGIPVPPPLGNDRKQDDNTTYQPY